MSPKMVHSENNLCSVHYSSLILTKLFLSFRAILYLACVTNMKEKVNNGWIQTSSICPTSSECANFVLLYIFRMFQVLNKGGKFLQERERTNALQCSALQLHANEDRTRAGKAFPTSLHEISSTMLRPIIGNFLRSQ